MSSLSTKKIKSLSKAKGNAEIEYFSIFGMTTHMSPIALHTYGEWFIEAARSLPMKPAPPNGPFDPV